MIIKLRHLLTFALCLSLTNTAGFAVAADDSTSSFDRKQDVVYGRKFGTALTMDVFTPKRDAKGVGLIFVVSGGWFSAHRSINPAFLNEFLDRGYTVFAVVHGSQPKFTIREIVSDMHRSVRYIRSNAVVYDIDPERIGIMGASAGGHLSLMQGTAGNEGDADASDPVERASSRVQTVACFFPPTDFLNYGQQGADALGRGKLKNFKAPFDFKELNRTVNRFERITDEEKLLEIGREISPVNHVTPDDPPSLIVHGDADKLVPIQQAEIIIEKFNEAKVPAKLVVKEGAGHGWPDITGDLKTLADWFDEHLLK